MVAQRVLVPLAKVRILEGQPIGDNMEKKFKDVFSISFGDWMILGIVFSVLKTHSVIDWSWWWVTAPFWIPVVMIIFGLIIATIMIRAEVKRNGDD